jgi:hypothetical protein
LALFTAKIYQLLTLLTAGQFTAHDVLRAFMPPPAQFAACKQAQLQPGARAEQFGRTRHRGGSLGRSRRQAGDFTAESSGIGIILQKRPVIEICFRHILITDHMADIRMPENAGLGEIGGSRPHGHWLVV